MGCCSMSLSCRVWGYVPFFKPAHRQTLYCLHLSGERLPLRNPKHVKPILASASLSSHVSFTFGIT